MIRVFPPRWRKVIRDMWSNKSRTLLVVMSIAVGIFAIGVVTGAQRVFLQALNDSYGSSNPASGRVFVDGQFGEDLVETIDNLREVAVAEGRREANLRYLLPGAATTDSDVPEEDQWKTIELVNVADFEAMEISKVLPKGGAWPPPDKEILLDLGSMEYLETEIGDTILIETADGKVREMPIAGIVRDQNGPPAAVTGVPSGYINRETLEWLNEPEDFTQLAFVVAENPLDSDHIQDVGEIIRRKIENNGQEVLFIAVPPPGQHPLNTVLQPLLLILTGLGGLALALSGFLVVNIISAILAQQTRQIGIMKSFGAQRGQIISLYLVTVFVYGLLALIVAIPLGAYGGWQLTLFLAEFFNVEVGEFTISPKVMIIQAIIAILIPFVAALVPVIIGTNVTVREAISDYGLGRGRFGTSRIDRFLQSIRGISRPAMISLRNTFRRKTRLGLTLFTLTLAGTTFITIYSVRDSILSTLDDILALWQYDINITFEEPYRSTRIDQVLTDIPGIDQAENWGFATVRRIRDDGTDSDNLALTAVPVDTEMLRPKLLQGRWLTESDANALVINTDFLQDETDVELGDNLVLELTGSKETSWTVVGIIQGTTVGAALFTNYDYYSRLVNEVDQAQILQLTTTSRDGDEHTAIAQRLELAFERAGLDVSRIDTITEVRSRTETGFNFLLTFLISMAGVLAVVGGLGLSGTMSINVLERVREIGVMRAIGASDWAVLQIVLIEGVTIGLLSWLMGALLALPLSRILSDQLGLLLLESPLSFAYSWFGLTFWLIIAVILSIISSYLPARSASRLTVREVLAYEG